MTFSSHKSRLTGVFLAVILLVLAGFVSWVVTAPEFNNTSGNQTLISRWNNALSSRMNQASRIFGGSRTVEKSREKKPGDEKPKEVTGPASVLVMDNRNRPIKDVTVTFRETSGRKTIKEKSDSKGRVQTKLPVGQYQLAFSHGKYSTEVRGNQRVAGPKSGFFVSVVLETRVVVKGTVLDEEGKPVPGASVTGQRNWLQQFSETAQVFLDDASYPTVVTNKKGSFQLDDVSIGSNTFTVSMTGYATAETRQEVPAGGLGKELKIQLKRPAKITGRVVDEAMQPLKGVKITAVSYQPYAGVPAKLPATGFSTSSDGEGRFQLKKLFSNGYYYLRFEHPGYAVLELPHVTADTSGLTRVMQRGGEISGRVEYLDRSTTAAHVLVQATGVIEGTTITRTAMSRGSGQYKFLRLPYGSYNLSVDYNNFVSEPRGKVTSAKDKPSRNNLVEVYEAALLNGEVEDAFSGDPIPGAQVTVKASYGFSKARVRTLSSRADDSGNFSFDKIPGGVHEVMATSRGYLPATNSREDRIVAVEPGGRVDDHTVFLSKGGTVKGQVVNQDGHGIGDCEVQLYAASGSFSGLNAKDLNQSTDGAGFFEFSGFPTGQQLSVYVSARKDGYAKRHSELVELTPQQPEQMTQVVLTPGGVVTGQVTDKEGVPLYGVKVTVDSREFPRDPSTSELVTYTDSQGQYLAEYCTPGKATLVADRDDYVRQVRSATIPEGRLLSRQDFKLELSRNIRGTVADFRGNPIADARVSAAPLPKSKGSGRATTDKRGDFLVEGLGNGSFRLEAAFNLDTPDGKQSYTFIVPEVPVGAVGVPIDCDLAPTAIGRVEGSEGAGLDTFQLTLRSRLDTDPKQLFRFNLSRKYSNAGGDLRLLNIPRGLYTLKIEAAGYETWENEEVMIGPGNRTRLPTIRMRPASQIIGTVVSSTTGKSVQEALVRVLDDSEEAVVTVNRIELAGYANTDIIERLDSAYDEDLKYDPDPNSRMVARVRGNVVTTAKTNVYGKFDINDLATGSYTIEIEHPSFRPKRIRNINVNRADQTDIGTVELEPGGTIRGRVIDLEGNGINNAPVQVRGEMQGRNRTRTDVAGNFEIKGIAFGEWPVNVRANLNGRKVYAWQKVNVRPDETSVVEFVLETSAEVHGRVQLHDGPPKSGTVRLYVVDETGTAMNDILYTGSIDNGRYTIKTIPPGRYFVIVHGKGDGGNFAYWQWVDINRGRNVRPLGGPSASMSGVATTVGGVPVKGANVQVVADVAGVKVPGVIQQLLELTEATNAAGKFSFPYLQAGTHRVWAAGPGKVLIPVDAIPIGEGQRIRDYRVAVQVDQ